MFRAVVFLAGPSRFSELEIEQPWRCWSPLKDSGPVSVTTPQAVYIADAGLDSFLSWYDAIDVSAQSLIQSILWCGDGDSLGSKGRERLSQAAARFEGRWREHVYDSSKDFSDCAAITSLIEYDLRHKDSISGLWADVHGALGGRLDHELANIFEFSASLSRLPAPSAYVLGSQTVLSTCAVMGQMNSGDTFTVLSSTPQCLNTFKITQAKYSGEIELRQPSHGLSNVALGEQVEIVPVKLNCPFIISRTEQKLV